MIHTKISKFVHNYIVYDIAVRHCRNRISYVSTKISYVSSDSALSYHCFLI